MTNIQEQNRKKGGRPPTGRVRKLSKSVTVKYNPQNEMFSHFGTKR